jgi:hypothetical protein
LLRAVLIPLVAGWIVALVFGLILARLQYTEVANAFSTPDRVSAEYEARINRELFQGPLLLLAQVGVVAGALAWQVGITARRAADPRLHGVVAGALLAVLEGGIAVAMQSPWTFVVPLVVVLVGVGIYSARIPAENSGRAT